jgi:hypothetical protein
MLRVGCVACVRMNEWTEQSEKARNFVLRPVVDLQRLENSKTHIGMSYGMVIL